MLSASAARLLDLIKLLLDFISGKILFRNPGSEKLRRASLHPDCSPLPPGDVAQFTPLPTTTSQAPGARGPPRTAGDARGAPAATAARGPLPRALGVLVGPLAAGAEDEVAQSSAKYEAVRVALASSDGLDASDGGERDRASRRHLVWGLELRQRTRGARRARARWARARWARARA